MRKVIIIAMVVMSAIACKKETIIIQEPLKCTIMKQRQMRTWSRTRPLSEWQNSGNPEFYSNDCSDINDKVNGYSGCQFNGECQEFRYILYKK